MAGDRDDTRDFESTAHVTRTNAHSRRASYLLVSGEGILQRHQLPKRGALVIGRGSKADIRVDHPSVSRAHATIHMGDEISVEDMGSHNGTRVSKVRLREGERAPIEMGVAFRMGSVTLTLETGSASRTGRHALTVDKASRTLRIARDEPITLGKRKALWHVIETLAEAHVRSPGAAVSQDVLLERGWPNERMHPEAAANRLYVAIATLRKMGLKEHIVSRDDGYLFAPGIDIVWS